MTKGKTNMGKLRCVISNYRWLRCKLRPNRCR